MLSTFEFFFFHITLSQLLLHCCLLLNIRNHFFPHHPFTATPTPMWTPPPYPTHTYASIPTCISITHILSNISLTINILKYINAIGFYHSSHQDFFSPGTHSMKSDFVQCTLTIPDTDYMFYMYTIYI